MEVKKALDPFSEYALGMLPATEVVANVTNPPKAKSKDYEVKFVVCCGTEDGSRATDIPIPWEETKDRKPWKGAKPVRMTPRNAEALAKQNEAGGGSRMDRFELVTVTP